MANNKQFMSVKAVPKKSLRKKMLFVGSAHQIVSSSPEISELLVRRIKKRFMQQVDSTGKAWEGYSSTSTQSRRLLYGSGDLYNSIGRADSNSGFGINTGAGFRITADAESQDGTLYGVLHNYGASNLPAREFMGVSVNDQRAVMRKFKQILDRTIITL